MPGTIKAVKGLDLGSRVISQNLVVGSRAVKTVDHAWPILAMHSCTSFVEYLSTKVLGFKDQRT